MLEAADLVMAASSARRLQDEGRADTKAACPRREAKINGRTNVAFNYDLIRG